MPVDTDTIRGKVFLLAGASGALGSVLARRLLAAGGRLAVAVRRPWQVEAQRQALGDRDVLVGCVPSLDGEAAAGFVKGAADALGAIDAYFCTAGAYRASTIGQDGAGELTELLEANLLAPATLARAVVGAMKRRRSGSLVFTGAAMVGHGGPKAVNYLASKAALHEYVRALAAELDGSGVRAAAVLPVVLDTEANRKAMPTADHSRWQKVEDAAETLLAAAFGLLPGPGPLYPVSGAG